MPDDEKLAPLDGDSTPRVQGATPKPSLSAWLGRAILGDPDSAVWRDERFLARLRRRGATGGELLYARALARRHGVRWAAHEPSFTRSTFDGTPAEAVDYGRTRRVSPLVELGVAAGVGRELWDEPVERWVAMPDDLAAGQHLALRIVGDSMSPLMHTDDTVLVRVGGALAEGSIIVARHPEDGYVCKLVQRVRGRSIELASLQPGRPLITIPRDAALVVGTVVMIWSPPRAT